MNRAGLRKFVGLSFTNETRDETSFIIFRQRLGETSTHERVLDAIVAHIEPQRLLVRGGTMVDALDHRGAAWLEESMTTEPVFETKMPLIR